MHLGSGGDEKNRVVGKLAYIRHVIPPPDGVSDQRAHHQYGGYLSLGVSELALFGGMMMRMGKMEWMEGRNCTIGGLGRGGQGSAGGGGGINKTPASTCDALLELIPVAGKALARQKQIMKASVRTCARISIPRAGSRC
jgi:hypothetical protein